jgi:hypothetical protein
MTPGQEIGVEGWVVEQGLEDDSLITGLSHVPDTTGTTAGARVLVRVVLDIDLRGRVFDPTVFAIYQIVSYSTREHRKEPNGDLRLTLVLKLAGRATESLQTMVVD